MKLKIWAEVVLIIIASVFCVLIFFEPLILNCIGCIGTMITCIPLAKYGRLLDKENERR